MIGIIECPNCKRSLALSMKVKFSENIEANTILLKMENIKVRVKDSYELKNRIFNDIKDLFLNKVCLEVAMLIKYFGEKYNLKLKLGLYEDKGVLYG